MEKITEIIDEKAFEQLERLLKDLGIAQSEFVTLATNVQTLNTELGKVKGFKDFETAVNKVVDAQEKMEKAQEKTVVATEKAVKAEKELVQATRMKITTDMDARKILDLYSGTLDENIKVQIKLKLALTEIRAEQKKLASDYKAGAVSAEQYGAEVQRLARLEIEAKQGLVDYNLEIRRAVKEANSAQGSYDQLSATLDRLRGLYRRLTDEEKASAEIGGRLQASINEYDEQLKKADKSLGIHTRNVGNYESALSKIPGPIGQLLSSWDDLVNLSNTVTTSLDNQSDTFSTVTNSMDTISFASVDASEALGQVAVSGNAAGVGLTNASTASTGFLAGLKAITRAAIAFIATPVGATIAAVSAGILAARGWFQYNKDLVEATRLTKQFTGLGGDDLKAFRSEIMATAKVFDRDFKEVIIAVNATSKQFGISQQEALDIVNKGFLAGADASGEFLDQLREYPSQLKAVGLSAEQTAAIITQNVQDGIYSDKGIDAIKEAGIRIREMTKSTKDAFTAIGMSGDEIQKQLQEGTISMFDVIQQVSARLKELPDDSREVGMALADIFGGAGEDAGIQYIKTLADIDLSLDSLVAKQGEVAKAQEMQLKATEELDKAFASLFDSTGGGFELLIANGKLFATNVLVAIVNGLIEVVNYAIDLYNESVLIRGIFQATLIPVKTLFTLLIGGFQRAFEGVKSFGELFKAVLSGNLKAIPGIIKNSISAQASAIKDLGKGIAENYVDAFNNTVNNKKIARITPGLGTTGAAGAGSTGSGGGTFRKIEDENILNKEQIDLIKRLRDAYLDLEIARSSRTAAESKRIADDEAKSFEDREAALNNYLFKSQQALELAAQKELSDTELTADERTRIEEQLQNDINDLKREGAAVGLQILTDQLSQDDQARLKANQKTLSGIEAERDARLTALNEAYQNGEMGELDYANNRLAIQREYVKKAINEEIRAVEALIAINKARGLDTFEQEKQLASLKLRLSQETTDKQIEDANRLLEEERKIADAKRQLGEELFILGETLVFAQFEREAQALDAQSEAIDRNREKQLERVEESVASEEDKAIKVAQIEQRAEQQKEAIDDRRRQLQQRQAVFEKAAAIARIIAATSTAIMVQLAGAPLFPISGPLIPIIAGIGAAQIAQVAATAIPAFATGTENSPEGLATVGERGSELRIDPDGRVSMTPGQTSLTYLKKGTKIIPADETRHIMAMAGMGSITGYDRNGGVDTEKMIKAFDKGLEKLDKTMKSKKQTSTIITKSGWKYMHESSNSRQEYLKRNLS